MRFLETNPSLSPLFAFFFSYHGRLKLSNFLCQMSSRRKQPAGDMASLPCMNSPYMLCTKVERFFFFLCESVELTAITVTSAAF